MKKILYIVGGIIVSIILIVIAGGGDEKKEIEPEIGSPPSQQQKIPLFQQQEQSIKSQPREYTVIEKEDISIKALDKPLSEYTGNEIDQLPMNIRMTYKIVVPSDITKEELKATLIQVIKDKTAKNKDVDEIMVFTYDREQDIDDAYTFGKVEWCPNGNWAGVTSIIASSNDRNSYKYVFDIKEKVGKEEGRPTEKEIEIYDTYWEILNEPGNPRGYISHPTSDESANQWEKEKINEVVKLYGVTRQEIYDIVSKVTIWKWK